MISGLLHRNSLRGRSPTIKTLPPFLANLGNKESFCLKRKLRKEFNVPVVFAPNGAGRPMARLQVDPNGPIGLARSSKKNKSVHNNQYNSKGTKAIIKVMRSSIRDRMRSKQLCMLWSEKVLYFLLPTTMKLPKGVKVTQVIRNHYVPRFDKTKNKLRLSRFLARLSILAPENLVNTTCLTYSEFCRRVPRFASEQLGLPRGWPVAKLERDKYYIRHHTVFSNGHTLNSVYYAESNSQHCALGGLLTRHSFPSGNHFKHIHAWSSFGRRNSPVSQSVRSAPVKGFDESCWDSFYLPASLDGNPYDDLNHYPYR